MIPVVAISSWSSRISTNRVASVTRPLCESIQMVGSLTQGRETFGLVKAGPNLYRVRKGNYMGQNFGVITGIDESQISLKELIQEGSGEWVERSSALQLQEVKR